MFEVLKPLVQGLFAFTKHHHPCRLSECSASSGTRAGTDRTSDAANPTALRRRCATGTSCFDTPRGPSCRSPRRDVVAQVTICWANKSNSPATSQTSARSHRSAWAEARRDLGTRQSASSSRCSLRQQLVRCYCQKGLSTKVSSGLDSIAWLPGLSHVKVGWGYRSFISKKFITSRFDIQ